MHCPKCLDNKVEGVYDKSMKCVDSREHTTNIRWRRYLCKDCGYRESTYERMKTTLKQGKMNNAGS